MKQIFTLAAAAVVALGATAAPRMEKVDVPISAMGAHRVMTTAAQLHNDLKAGIERPGTVKRSSMEGNIEWSLVMVPGQELFEYFYPGGIVTNPETGQPTGQIMTIEEIPFYGVECVLTGVNVTNEQEYAFFPLLLCYPTQYYKQLSEYRGPLEEGDDGLMYIPDGAIDYDYSIIPFVDLMNDPNFKPRWMDMNGYFQWSLGDEQGYYLGDNYFGIFGFSGAHYGYNTAGNQYIQLDTEFDMETNRNAPSSVIDFTSYSIDDSWVTFSSKFLFKYGTINSSTGRFEASGGTGECSVEFDGAAYINGIGTRTMEFKLDNLQIFNAGLLDYDEMGDSYPFSEFPENPLQMYYVCGGGEGFGFGLDPDKTSAIQKDPSFNFDYIALGLTSQNADFDNFISLNGCIFNNVDDSWEAQNYSLNPAFEKEEKNPFTGTTTIETDCIDPKANTFVTRAITSEGTVAPWFRNYAMKGTYFSGYYNYPLNDNPAYIATNTERGIVFYWEDQFGNKVTYLFDGLVLWHYDSNDITLAEEVESMGENKEPGLGIQNVFNAFDSVKVSAKNGVISVLSAENADVQVINLNGQLVNNAKAVAGETVNVKADKGLYIVKVGKQVRKVVL